MDNNNTIYEDSKLEAATGRTPLTKEEIKAIRVELDSILVRVQKTGYLRTKALVEQKLKESRHWLGEQNNETK